MKTSGFTLVELVMAMVIVGVLSAVAIPRFTNRSTFDARGFSDQLAGMLRYAQKYAIAQRRPVYVRLNGTSVALCLDNACASPVRAPAGTNSGTAATLAACGNSTTWFCEATPGGVAYASSVSLFYFNALGKPYLNGDVPPASSFATMAVSVSGGGITRIVTIEADTGYVH